MPCFPLVAPTTTHSFLLLGPIFANLGLVSCHLSYCLNLASTLASRALAAHARALLCPTLNAHATRTHVPTCLVLVACAAHALSCARCHCTSLRLSHSMLLRPSLLVRLALLSCLPQARPCCCQDFAQGHKPSHGIRPMRPKVVT